MNSNTHLWPLLVKPFVYSLYTIDYRQRLLIENEEICRSMLKNIKILLKL